MSTIDMTGSGETCRIAGYTGIGGYGPSFWGGYIMRATSPVCFNLNATGLKLWDVIVYQCFQSGTDNMNTLTVPNDGETVNCDITMFDDYGIQFKLTSITNQDGDISIQTVTTDKSGCAYRSKPQFYCQIGTMQPGDISTWKSIDSAQIYDPTNSLIPANPIQITQSALKPGDQFVINILTMQYVYGWDYDSSTGNVGSSLGEINLQ